MVAPNCLKFRLLPNRISFDVFDRCFCKFETRACETLRSCGKRFVGLAVRTSPGAPRSFNPALPSGDDHMQKSIAFNPCLSTGGEYKFRAYVVTK